MDLTVFLLILSVWLYMRLRENSCSTHKFRINMSFWLMRQFIIMQQISLFLIMLFACVTIHSFFWLLLAWSIFSIIGPLLSVFFRYVFCRVVSWYLFCVFLKYSITIKALMREFSPLSVISDLVLLLASHFELLTCPILPFPSPVSCPAWLFCSPLLILFTGSILLAFAPFNTYLRSYR